MTRLLFFGGKGGVGKTTLATAAALMLAEAGERTLLVSTDPAHSTGDLLGTRLGNEPRRVADRLEALEIDAEADADAYVARIAAEAAATVSPQVLPTVQAHLRLARSSPGTVESALLDRFVALMTAPPGRWDRLVFDTAPTGHTLRLLALPELLSGWVEGMTRQRERVAGVDRMLRNLAGAEAPAAADPVVTRLRERRRRLAAARDRLRRDAAFCLVLVPERLPILETARAAEALSGQGLPVAAVVVNRVLPSSATGWFMRARLADQAGHLRDIERRFAGRRVVPVEHAPHDVTAPADLAGLKPQLAPALDAAASRPPTRQTGGR